MFRSGGDPCAVDASRRNDQQIVALSLSHQSAPVVEQGLGLACPHGHEQGVGLLPRHSAQRFGLMRIWAVARGVGHYLHTSMGIGPLRLLMPIRPFLRNA